MLHYSMVVELPEPERFSAEQVADALDTLGDRYDSALIRPDQIEFDGSVRQVYGIAHIMLDLRSALGWPEGLRFRVERDPSDRYGNPLQKT